MVKPYWILGLILTVFFALSSLAQTRITHKESRADRHFEQEYYYKAAELYQKVIKKNPTNERAKLKLARTYFKANKPDEAVSYYVEVIHKKYLVKSIDYLNYARVLQSVEHFESARKWAEKYLAINPRSVIAQNLVNSLHHVNKYYHDSSRYVVKSMNINTEASEFAPSFFQNGIVFVSSRSKKHSLKRNYSRDRSKYLNLYFSEGLIGAEMWTKPEKIKGEVNNRFHQGPATFYQNQQMMVYTGSTPSSAQVNQQNLKLYSAKFSNEKSQWENVTELPFNTEVYSTGHPSMNATGDTLYFVSDRPGGAGGTDLYQVSKVGDNWSNPINMGSTINTPGDEMFPYISSENILYFSSNGRGGLGGLDIFMIDLDDPKGHVRNIGFPVNNTRDDFGIIYDGKKSIGYFSSDRGGQTDLYQFHITGYSLQVVLSNEGQEPVYSGQVLLQSHGHTIDTQIPSGDGKITFQVSPGQEYQIMAESDQYEVMHRSYTYTATDHHDTLKLTMKSLDTTPIAGTLLVVKGVESSKSYVLTAELVIEVKESELSDDQWLDKLLTDNNIEIKQTVDINPIHYRFDKYTIDDQYLGEVDKLAMVMKKYSFIDFELGAFTDTLGSQVYNQALSEKRANTVLDYLRDKNVASDRLLAVGHGENNAKYQDRINRRPEFSLIYMDENQVVSNY